MKVVVQKCLEGSVKVDDKIVGKINNGLVLLVGFTYNDTIEEIDYLVRKIVNLRIFDDSKGVMNKSILDVGGEILSVSQFTLYADTSKGNRPSYVKALNPNEAIKLYDIFNEKLSNYVHVERGIFKADMKVSLVNDGPATILLEKEHNV